MTISVKPDADTLLDCLVIGGGPAGLTAATYLGRFRRKTCLVHNGDSRVMQVPWLRNCPGFPDGISGRELLERLRRQASLYGASFHECGIETLEARPGGGFTAVGNGQVFHARTVILATGLIDRKPEVPGMGEAIASGVVRLCPVCDGYEAAGHRVGVIGSDEHALREAVFLRGYSDDVTLISRQPGAALRAAAAERRVGLIEATGNMAAQDGAFTVELTDGTRTSFDAVYPALGCDVRSRLAVSLGANRDGEGYIRVDPHQKTNIEGLYACGDVVHALNQVAVAFGQAAIAASAVHNLLREDVRLQVA